MHAILLLSQCHPPAAMICVLPLLLYMPPSSWPLLWTQQQPWHHWPQHPWLSNGAGGGSHLCRHTRARRGLRLHGGSRSKSLCRWCQGWRCMLGRISCHSSTMRGCAGKLQHGGWTRGWRMRIWLVLNNRHQSYQGQMRPALVWGQQEQKSVQAVPGLEARTG